MSIEEYLENKFQNYQSERFLSETVFSLFKNWENYNEMIKFNYESNNILFLIEIKKTFDLHFFPNIISIDKFSPSLSFCFYSKDIKNIDKIIDFYCLNKNFILDICRISFSQNFPYSFQKQFQKRSLISYNLDDITPPYSKINFKPLNIEEDVQKKFISNSLTLFSKLPENVTSLNYYPLDILFIGRTLLIDKKLLISRIAVNVLKIGLLTFEFNFNNLEIDKLLKNEFIQIFIKLLFGLGLEKKFISSMQEIIFSNINISANQLFSITQKK